MSEQTAKTKMTAQELHDLLMECKDEMDLEESLNNFRMQAKSKGDFDKFARIVRRDFRAKMDKLRQMEQNAIAMAYAGGECTCSYHWHNNEPYILERFRMDDAGVTCYDPKEGIPVVICSNPVVITSVAQDQMTLEQSYCLAVKSDIHGWTRITRQRKQLTGRKNILECMSGCVSGLTEATADRFADFINDQLESNKDLIAKKKASSHMGWQTDREFVPYSDNYVYIGDNPVVADYIHQEGSMVESLNLFKKVWLEGNTKVKMAIAAALTADDTDGLSFWLHIFGSTGTGKTVLLNLLASIWGDPSKLTNTFSSTDVGLEQQLGCLYDIPLFVDEGQTAGGIDETVRKLYKATEGTGKVRGAKTGGNRDVLRWRSNIISTGEKYIVDPDTGRGAGAVNRIINLEIGTTQLFSDFGEIVETCRKNFGFIGKAYTEMRRKCSREKMNEMVDAEKAKILSHTDASGKQAMAGARILVASHMLVLLLNLPKESTLQARDFAGILVTNRELDENAKCYDRIRTLFAEHATFFEGGQEDLSKQEKNLWGKLIGSSQGRTLIFPSNGEFARIISEDGYQLKSFMHIAESKGIALSGAGGKSTSPVRIAGVLTRCYRLLLDQDWDSGLSLAE